MLAVARDEKWWGGFGGQKRSTNIREEEKGTAKTNPHYNYFLVKSKKTNRKAKNITISP